MKILFVFGTRPEAIKMAPVYRTFVQEIGKENVDVCVTAQHREMLDQVLNLFDISPDFDLDLMQKDQTLEELTGKIISEVCRVIDSSQPDIVLVQGDTTTCFAAALAAFYKHVKVGHIEAGLRSGNTSSPWPEEMNRRLTGQIAGIHFPPTLQAKNNLLAEGFSRSALFVTGNTVIDALFMALEKIKRSAQLREELQKIIPRLDPERKCILVTGHRRENFGLGFERVCRAIAILSKRKDVQVVYPVHLNPNVQKPVNQILAGNQNVHLIEPLDYLPFVYLMSKSYLIITDSGGVQEEAPALGIPVLVTRDTTERPEGVTAGTVQLVGTDTEVIESKANQLLDDLSFYEKCSSLYNPYGDGKASVRICWKLLNKGIDEYE